MASLRMKMKSKVDNSTQQSAAAAFTLPESLQCSDISFPILLQSRPKANWHQILEERDHTMKEIEEYDDRNKTRYPKPPFQKTACDYIEKEVFSCLLPALEDTLVKAKMWNAFQQPRCLFNGIDWIAQEIWNNNPRHPTRKYDQKHVFNIPWVRKYLIKNPRVLYPKSWLWPDEYAATVIQKTVRQYFVQREVEVQEMRDFWRKLEMEKTCPELTKNQFLAKEFAHERQFSLSAQKDKKDVKKEDEPKKEEDRISKGAGLNNQEANKEEPDAV